MSLSNTEEEFLNFLEETLESNPEIAKPVSVEYWNKIGDLVKDVEVNLDEPLTD